MVFKRLLNGLLSLLNGAGQVMFQQSPLAGALFLAGIFWGAFECGTPQVALGAVLGLAASTLAGALAFRRGGAGDGGRGLWGFNGILVGCALPTFLADTAGMWVALIIGAMLTPLVRASLDRLLKPLGIGSLTFPFVLLTWVLLLCLGASGAVPPAEAAASAAPTCVRLSAATLAEGWLKGISQVFLINSSVTGALFLAGLAVSDFKAALWCAAGSAIAVATAALFNGDPGAIADGLYGFNPALTGIAIGLVFTIGRRTAWPAIAAILATLLVQAAVGALAAQAGLPTLTAPFCLTTWIFIIIARRLTRGG
ncbi:MAG: urea transporter [[Clostridium] fimetarium]|nr:urea transporter [Alistipes timonensis]MCM1405852.1 urea transporter [[Clostridium] fimetarium]